jgi:Tfp pilus assembly protein PilP
MKNAFYLHANLKLMPNIKEVIMGNHLTPISVALICGLMWYAASGCAMKDDSSDRRGIISKKINAPRKGTMPSPNLKHVKRKTVISQKKAMKHPPYNPKNKPNPFVPQFQLGSSREKPGVPRPIPWEICRDRSELTHLSLSQLKLVAVIRTNSGNCALLQEASNRGHVVKENNCIGVNFGRVSRIFSDKIVIEERFEDFTDDGSGGWKKGIVTRKKEIKMQKPKTDA